MSKILWIINKYVGSEESEEFYSHFLKNTQQELEKKGNQLSFVFFSDILSECKLFNNQYVYRAAEFDYLSEEKITAEAQRIERDYGFTFKQAYFADILQTFKEQNQRKITVPKKYFCDLSFLVPKFLFLENLILTKNFEVIFSDASPEVEMEFGRIISNSKKIIALKSYEGSALGNTVILQLLDFGKDRWIEVPGNFDWTLEEARGFCSNFINKRQAPYIPYSTSIPSPNTIYKISKTMKGYYFGKFSVKLIRLSKRLFVGAYYAIERILLKPIIYSRFDSKIPYIFIGFHLNQESTIVLRSQPFTNQIALVEMISRVLPYNYVLYVREHPHWPDRFPFSYLKKMSEYPNIKIISPRISIHEILKECAGILTYNATTGIEALIYNKPVLSFASNIYSNYHTGVDQCSDLFELGKKLSQLINRKIDNEETINYIYNLKKNSITFGLGSYNFSSVEDSESKALIFSNFLSAAICKVHEISSYEHQETI